MREIEGFEAGRKGRYENIPLVHKEERYSKQVAIRMEKR